MSMGRYACAIVSLPGSILVVSGLDADAETNTTEALSLRTMTFAAGPTMLTARYGCAAFVMPQDHSSCRALVVGGINRGSNLPTTEVLAATD